MIVRPIFALFVLLLTGANVAASEGVIKDKLVMAFVPSRETTAVQLSADLIAEYLSKETGYSIKAITVSNYAAVVVGLSTRRVDFAFVGPLSYLVAHHKTGAYPVTSAVRHGKKGYHGLILTKKGSDITTLKDLVGRSFAFGDALSTSANLYPRSAMMDADLDPDRDFRSLTISSQPAIVAAILGGKVSAGAVYDDARLNPGVLKRYPNALEDTVVVYKTPLIPADPQIVRKDLHPAQVAAIAKGLKTLARDVEGKKWLKALFNIDDLVETTDAEYDGLRAVVAKVRPGLLQ